MRGGASVSLCSLFLVACLATYDGIPGFRLTVRVGRGTLGGSRVMANLGSRLVRSFGITTSVDLPVVAALPEDVKPSKPRPVKQEEKAHARGSHGYTEP